MEGEKLVFNAHFAPYFFMIFKAIIIKMLSHGMEGSHYTH